MELKKKFAKLISCSKFCLVELVDSALWDDGFDFLGTWLLPPRVCGLFCDGYSLACTQGWCVLV